MKIFRGQQTSFCAQRRAMLEELESLARRARVLPLVAPVLLLGGWGLGKLTMRALELPGGSVVRTGVAAEPSRIHLEALSRHLQALREHGTETAEYVMLYQAHIAPVERALYRRGVPPGTARRVAWPLVEHAYRRGVDPATVVSVLLVESRGRPYATSPVGARGLMQVMPDWEGRWRGCGRNLYDIEDNLCNGISILAWYLRRSAGDERRALLGYNGCIRGSNTPDCWRYPDKIARLRHQIRRELHAGQRAAPAAAAP